MKGKFELGLYFPESGCLIVPIVERKTCLESGLFP